MGWKFKKSESAKPAKKTRNWGLIRDGHAEAAVRAAASGDSKKAAWHHEQQKAAVQNAQAEGMWWIKA